VETYENWVEADWDTKWPKEVLMVISKMSVGEILVGLVMFKTQMAASKRLSV